MKKRIAYGVVKKESISPKLDSLRQNLVSMRRDVQEALCSSWKFDPDLLLNPEKDPFLVFKFVDKAHPLADSLLKLTHSNSEDYALCVATVKEFLITKQPVDSFKTWMIALINREKNGYIHFADNMTFLFNTALITHLLSGSSQFDVNFCFMLIYSFVTPSLASKCTHTAEPGSNEHQFWSNYCRFIYDNLTNPFGIPMESILELDNASERGVARYAFRADVETFNQLDVRGLAPYPGSETYCSQRNDINTIGFLKHTLHEPDFYVRSLPKIKLAIASKTKNPLVLLPFLGMVRFTSTAELLIRFERPYQLVHPHILSTSHFSEPHFTRNYIDPFSSMLHDAGHFVEMSGKPVLFLPQTLLNGKPISFLMRPSILRHWGQCFDELTKQDVFSGQPWDLTMKAEILTDMLTSTLETVDNKLVYVGRDSFDYSVSMKRFLRNAVDEAFELLKSPEELGCTQADIDRSQQAFLDILSRKFLDPVVLHRFEEENQRCHHHLSG